MNESNKHEEEELKTEKPTKAHSSNSESDNKTSSEDSDDDKNSAIEMTNSSSPTRQKVC